MAAVAAMVAEGEEVQPMGAEDVGVDETEKEAKSERLEKTGLGNIFCVLLLTSFCWVCWSFQSTPLFLEKNG